MSSFDWNSLPKSPRGDLNSPPPETPESEGPSQLEAVGRGALQGATAGFSDELIGGAQAFFDKYIKNNPAALVELYRRHRDEERAKNEAASTAHPLTYGAANLAGAVGTGALTGGASLPAAVGYGAANALGSSNADVTKGEVGEAAKDTATGAIAGGVLHGAGQLVGKGLSSMFKGSSDEVAQQGAKALGLSQAHIADLGERGDLQRVVQQAEKDGVFKPGATLNDTLQRFQAARNAKAEGLKAAVANADAKGATVDITAARQELEAKLASSAKDPTIVGEGYANGMQSAIAHLNKFETPAPASAADVAAQIKAGVKPEDIKATGGAPTNISVKTGQLIKQGLQAAADYNSKDNKPAEQAMNDAAAIVRKHVIQGAGPDYAKALEESHAYEAAGRAQYRDAIIKGTSAVGGIGASTAPVAAGMLAVTGHPVGAALGITAMLAQKQARQRAQSALYWAMKKSTGDGGVTTTGKLTQLLTSNPAVLGKYAGFLSQALASGGEDKLNQTHYVLSQTDPHYRDTIEAVHKSSQEDLGGLPPADEATSE